MADTVLSPASPRHRCREECPQERPKQLPLQPLHTTPHQMWSQVARGEASAPGCLATAPAEPRLRCSPAVRAPSRAASGCAARCGRERGELQTRAGNVAAEEAPSLVSVSHQIEADPGGASMPAGSFSALARTPRPCLTPSRRPASHVPCPGREL